jgi:urease accessory protein
MTAALLTLADSRLPAGGHTHSGGVEQAIAAGVVHGSGSLAAFLRRRLATSGAVAAGLAAAACAAIGPDDGSPEGPQRRDKRGSVQEGDGTWPRCRPEGDSVSAMLAALDAEADARTPSPALRAASRQQGRGLVRVGRRAWPGGAWDALPDRPHHPLALGVAAAAGGLGPREAAQAAAYLSISGPATAAQRLLAMDPLTVAAVTARLAPEIDAVADGLYGHKGPISAATDPLLDLLAEVHAARKDRYFAS